MESGPQQLADWLERRGFNQREGARHLGIHHTTLNKMLQGVRRPSLDAADDIEVKTGIPVSAWTTRIGKAKKSKTGRAKNANVDRQSLHV